MSAVFFTGSILLDPEHATDGWTIRHQCAVSSANGPAKPSAMLIVGPLVISVDSPAVVQRLIDKLEALHGDLLKAADLIDSGATTVAPHELASKHAAYVAQIDHDLADERARPKFNGVHVQAEAACPILGCYVTVAHSHKSAVFPDHTTRYAEAEGCADFCLRCSLDAKRAEQGAKS